MTATSSASPAATPSCTARRPASSAAHAERALAWNDKAQARVVTSLQDSTGTDQDQDFHSETRRTTAFFATREAADKVVRDLGAIGYGPDRVKLEASAAAEGGLAQSDAERGEAGASSHGYIVRVDTVTNADFERVTAILDDDATVTLDARTAVRTGSRSLPRASRAAARRDAWRRGRGPPTRWRR